MTCYRPIKVYRDYSDLDQSTGKWKILFAKPKSKHYLKPEELYIPCGHCTGCLLDKAKEWSFRCYLESIEYDHNMFITLTYDDDHMPLDGSLKRSDFVNFMKRYRNEFGEKIRYFMCGEYGSKTLRPHYHAIIFNSDLPDKVCRERTPSHSQYTSEILESLWGHGMCDIGDVSPQSIAYVTRYCVKKQFSKTDFGKLGVCEEYRTMSRRPALGTSFYEKYKDTIFKLDYFYTENGFKLRVPRIFDRKYEVQEPEKYKELKLRRNAKLFKMMLDKLDPDDKKKFKKLITEYKLCEVETDRLYLNEQRRQFMNSIENKRLDRLLVSEKVADAKLALFNQRSKV